MAKHSRGKLNRLEHLLPEGLLVDAAWLTKKRYSTSLRSQYVAAGWLAQPTRRVYRRPRGSLQWQQVIISLQMLLNYSLAVGGRSALEMQGYAHYLPQRTKQVHLYGPKRPPVWLDQLRLDVRFHYHNSRRLFGSNSDALTNLPWGQWNWPLVLSTPERALLELLDELPGRESFHEVDKLVEGLTNLSPQRLQGLLESCRSVKVKRLFFFFADRHAHAWARRIQKKSVDLGKGKRMLVKGGKLDPTYQITVPEDLNGVS
jgi:hypothetical protein